jgi:hypothetical protein
MNAGKTLVQAVSQAAQTPGAVPVLRGQLLNRAPAEAGSCLQGVAFGAGISTFR